jgi:hypothetical protein
MNKNILLASFISLEILGWFLQHLEDKFNIPKEKVFIFRNLDDEFKVIVTFKFVIQTDNRVNFNSLFPNTILIHKKGNAIYTINALNKLIEEISDDTIGNIDYKTVKINWEDYQGKMLLINNNKLKISDIKRIF